MNERLTDRYVYVKRLKKEQHFRSLQFSIIVVFIAIVVLISIWLPFYIANLPFGGS